jgi:hypothetical protein
LLRSGDREGRFGLKHGSRKGRHGSSASRRKGLFGGHAETSEVGATVCQQNRVLRAVQCDTREGYKIRHHGSGYMVRRSGSSRSQPLVHNGPCTSRGGRRREEGMASTCSRAGCRLGRDPCRKS